MNINAIAISTSTNSPSAPPPGTRLTNRRKHRITLIERQLTLGGCAVEGVLRLELGFAAHCYVDGQGAPKLPSSVVKVKRVHQRLNTNDLRTARLAVSNLHTNAHNLCFCYGEDAACAADEPQNEVHQQLRDERRLSFIRRVFGKKVMCQYEVLQQ